MSTATGTDRRKFTRYSLPSMYSRVMVRRADSEEFCMDGHAYDISRGGIRFELDEAIEAGAEIAVRIDLPQTVCERSTERRSVFAFANVVWNGAEDVTGPVVVADGGGDSEGGPSVLDDVAVGLDGV